MYKYCVYAVENKDLQQVISVCNDAGFRVEQVQDFKSSGKFDAFVEVGTDQNISNVHQDMRDNKGKPVLDRHNKPKRMRNTLPYKVEKRLSQNNIAFKLIGHGGGRLELKKEANDAKV